MKYESRGVVVILFQCYWAFNGFFLSAYFAFFVKHKSAANCFLSALLLMVSIRVTKSVFLVFYPDISSLFVQIGLSACALIGPFLYLYVRASTSDDKPHQWHWLLHVGPAVAIMGCVSYFYPYWDHRTLWRFRSFDSFGWILYAQWLVYIVLSFIVIKDILLGKSFSAFVNEYRVKAAEGMLTTHHQLTLEAIGNECGFKSKSSFYAAFKKYRGVTPAQRKKMLN